MAISTLTSKGQITLPRRVRERLRLTQGDQVIFTVEPSGDVSLRRAASASDGDALSGILRHLRRRRPVSVSEMNKAVRRRARARQAGAKRP